MVSSLNAWLIDASLPVIGIFLFGSMMLASLLGYGLRHLQYRRTVMDDGEAGRITSQEGYLVSGVLGLLALLTAFTFSLALDRFEFRRQLVITEANAIGTAYLRSQILDEPHRTRLSRLLVAYTDNRIALGSGQGDMTAKLATNDRLLTEIWAGVTASADSARDRGISTPLLNTFNEVIDLDTERKVARQARVPPQVFVVLYVFTIITATVLGYVLEGLRGRVAGAVLFLLLTLTVIVIVDLNRPTSGAIRESQEPMEMLRRSMAAQPPAEFDRIRRAWES